MSSFLFAMSSLSTKRFKIPSVTSKLKLAILVASLGALPVLGRAAFDVKTVACGRSSGSASEVAKGALLTAPA